MSAKRNQSLNISGFSPIQLNISSPAAIKSPGKDYGITERVEAGKLKIFVSYDRWKLADFNGSQCIEKVHNLKEKARQCGDNPYPDELETYSKKLAVVLTVLKEEIQKVATFRKEINGSINILETMQDNEDLQTRLETIQKFLDKLIQLYKMSLQMKQFIIENIAHTTSSQDSQILMASWTCDSSHDKLFQMITQLKISPPDHQWNTT